MALRHSPYIVTDGLVLYLDAGNAKSYVEDTSIWYDLTTLGGDASMVSGPIFDSVDNSFNFTGNNGFFQMERDDLNGGSFSYPELTWIIWLNPSDAGGTTSTGNIVLCIEQAFEISIGDNSDGTSNISYASNPWAWRNITSSPLTNEVWNMLTYTHYSTGRDVFINDSSVYHSSDAGNIGTGNASYPHLRIGERSALSSLLEGKIAIIQLYNRALTNDEIKQNFKSMKSRFNIN